MTRKIRFVVEVELDDLSPKERAGCAALDGCEAVDLPSLVDYELQDLVHPIVGDLEERNEDVWAGTGVFAQIVGSNIVSMEEI